MGPIGGLVGFWCRLILLRATHWVFILFSLCACKEKIKQSKTSFSFQNGGMVWEIEPKLAYWHNLTRKGRSSHGDDPQYLIPVQHFVFYVLFNNC